MWPRTVILRPIGVPLRSIWPGMWLRPCGPNQYVRSLATGAVRVYTRTGGSNRVAPDFCEARSNRGVRFDSSTSMGPMARGSQSLSTTSIEVEHGIGALEGPPVPGAGPACYGCGYYASVACTLCPYSSVGQSSGLLIRWSQVRILLGAPLRGVRSPVQGTRRTVPRTCACSGGRSSQRVVGSNPTPTILSARVAGRW